MAMVIRLGIPNKDERQKLISVLTELGLKCWIEKESEYVNGLKQVTDTVYFEVDDEECWYNTEE